MRQTYLNQPYEVSIETLASCNASCSFCPYPTLERKGERMPDALLHRLIDEMGEFERPFWFSPFKVSEPLLDKRLPDVLARIDANSNATTRIFTNGAALTLKNAEELAQPQRLELWVSLHATDEVFYREHVGVCYDKVLKNLDALHDTDFPHSVVVLKVGMRGGQQFVDYVRKRWPYFRPAVIKQDGWLGYATPDQPEIPETWCSRWFELSIMASGVVSLCCMDGKGDYPLGDLNEQTLLEVYNTPTWRERREKLDSRANYFPCSTCTY